MAYSSKFTEEVLSSEQKNKKKKSGYVESVLNGTYKSELPKVDISHDEEDIAPSINNSSNLMTMTRTELLNKQNELQEKIKNYDRKENPDRQWWEDDKNVLENLIMLPIKAFSPEFSKSKYLEDPEYDKLVKEYEEVQKAVEDNYVANKTYDKGIAGTIEKSGEVFLGNVQTGLKGVESTAKKILSGVFNKEVEIDTEPTLNEKISQKVITESEGGEKVYYDVVGSVGRMFPQMIVPSGTAATVMGFANYGGGAYNQAKREGYSEEEATKYGLVIGSLEMATSKALGSFSNIYGKTKLGNASQEVIDKVIPKIIKNKQVRNVLGQFVTEGEEEFLQEYIESVTRDTLLDDKGFLKSTWENVSDPDKFVDALYSGFVGGLTGSTMAIPSQIDAYKYEKATGRDAETGLTGNEQKVVDSEVAKRTEGKNLTKKQIADIETQVKNDLEKGYISTDTIESVLGGDTYTNLKSTRDNKIKIENEIKELESKKNADITVKEMEHLKDLREQLKEIDTNTLETELQSKMGQIIKFDGYLQRSYQEKANKGQKFTYEADKITNENEKAVYESATKVMNNTNRSHEFVEKVAKLSKDKGTKYEFTNNAELEKSNYDVKGRQVNGLVAVEENGKKKILINVDSSKALNTIVGHETTHLLEGTTEYKELQDAIFNYAKTKGDFDSRQASLYSLYKDIKGADVNSELTADLVGDYLFTDNNFINELSTQKPTVFQKIKELIDDLVVRFKGTKEEKVLREVQKKFKEAYRQSATQPNTDTQYNIESVGKFSQEEYNNITELELPKNEYGRLAHIIDSTTDIKSGVNHVILSDKTYEVYYKGYNDFKVVDVFDTVNYEERDSNGINRNANNINKGIETTRSGPNDNQFSNVKGENKRATRGNDGLYDFNKGENSKQEYSDSKSNGNQKQELDNSSFFNTQYSVSDNKGYHYGDLGKGRDTNYFSMTNSRRSTGHFGTGTYFVGNSSKVSDRFKEGRPEHKVSFDDYNLYKVETNTEGWTLHDGLKAINNQEFSNSDLRQLKRLLERKYQINEEQFNNSIEKTMDYILKTENANWEDKLKADSPSTYFMKQLGFEGIDTRNADQLDNSSYGSVIYDLKTNNDTQYSLTDNQGRTLTKEQQEYFKDSKVRDENGNLKIVYHGSDFAGFTEFGPKNNEGNYKYGEDTITFLTDSKEIAKSYTKSNEMIDTYRLYTVQNAEEWLESIGLDESIEIQQENGLYIVEDIDNEETISAYKTEEELLRNFKRDIQNSHGDPNAGGIYEGYANITNPYVVDAKHQDWNFLEEYQDQDMIDAINKITPKQREEISNLINTRPIDLAMQSVYDIVGSDVYNKLGRTHLIELASDEFSDFRINDIATKFKTTNDIVQEVLESNKNGETNYDGVIFKNIRDVGSYGVDSATSQQRQTVYVTFNSNQFKAKDNYNPTTDEDIRYSLGDDTLPRNPNLTYGEDVKYQEAIAPLKEEIQTLTETVNELKEQLAPVRDEYAPLTEEDLPYLEQQYNEAPKEDIAPPETEENIPITENEITSTKSLFETRNYEEVGNRKVNAYQYDNPEVKPYFQEAARSMIDDLAYSLKGQRFYNDQVYYDTNGEQGFFGINRFTSNDIAELLDGIDGKYKLSYKDLEKGLKAIIEDHGAENNAASKRIEFYLDKRLREGFTTLDGVEIPANQEYIKLLQDKEILDYYSNIPIGEAPVKEIKINDSGQGVLGLETLNELKASEGEIKNKEVEPIDVNTAKQLTIEGKEEDLVTKTKKELRKALLGTKAQKEIITNALDNAKNRSMALLNNTDTIRNTELVFGRDAGNVINEIIFQKEIDNEADSIAWQNKERQEIKDLGIKARSKESAAVQKYGEKQYVNDNNEVIAYGDAELSKEFSDVATQEKIKNAAKVIRNKYDAYIDNANNVLTKLGFEPIKKRKDYMRHFQELNDVFSRHGIPFNAQNMQEHTLPTDINGLTEFWSPQKNYFANMQPRKGMKTTYDAITGIDGYIGGIANLIYHTEDIQRGRAFEELIRETYGEDKGWDNLENLPDELQQARIEKIQDNHLSNYAAWVHEWTNNIAGKKSKIDRSVESMFGRKAFAVLDEVRKQVGSNMIGLNLSSSLTNLIAPIQAASKINKVAVLKGTADTIKNMFIKDNFMDNNKFLTARMGTDMLSQNAWQKMQNAGFVFMKGMDWFSSNQIVRSKYYELRAKGMSEAQAHSEAGKFAARILGDRTKGANAQLYNSKLVGLVTQFQLEVNNQLYSQFYDTYHESKEAAQGNALKTAAGMTFTLGQLFALTHLFGQTFEAIAGYNPTFDVVEMLKTAFGWGDDEEEEEKTLSERLKSAADQLVDALPYVNILTGGGRIPVASGIPNLVGVATGGKDQYGNELTLEDEMKKLLYLIPPTGGNQFKKTTQGLAMFDENLPVTGSYTDSGNLRFPVEDTLGNRVQAAIFGQWANENAGNYFDNERQPLKEKQIQEYADLDMPIKDYWKYREGLKEQSTIEEKFEYINGLDVTDEQKNIMINNATGRENPIDMSGYDNFGSYDEFDYATKNPDKYRVIEQIDTFDNFNSYKEDIKSIKEQFSEDNGYSTKDRKAAVQQYINSLSLDIPQKIMLEKMAGGYSIKGYMDYMYGYIESLPMTAEEKKAIHNQLFD